MEEKLKEAMLKYQASYLLDSGENPTMEEIEEAYLLDPLTKQLIDDLIEIEE